MKLPFSGLNMFGSSDKEVQVSIDQLRVGMFVSKLDRDWLESPFLLQGFLIESQEHIDQIDEYCDFVWIDKSKGAAPAIFGSSNKYSKGKSSDKSPIAFSDEKDAAAEIYSGSRQIVKTALDEIRLSGKVVPEDVNASVSDCVDSVLRNRDALLWMSKMRGENEEEAEHALNVSILSISLGHYLGYEAKALHNIGISALLHDIGKMLVPDTILKKKGGLDPGEWQELINHTAHGRDLLMLSNDIYHGAVDVAYAHHEHFDGTGYPRGLKGVAIPEYARIVAITDFYDSVTASRSYSQPKTSTEALKLLYEERGKRFDATFVDAFMKMSGLYPPGTIVELTSGEVGIVIETNHRYQHLPQVMIMLDSNKNPIDYQMKNLADIEAGKLDKSNFIAKAHVSGSFGLKLNRFVEEGSFSSL